jgi:hypothetical protein
MDINKEAEIIIYNKTIIFNEKKRLLLNFCENCKEEFSLRSIKNNGEYHFVWEIQANFCPFCGRKRGVNNGTN